MELQQKISKIKLEDNIGKEFEAIIDDVTDDNKYYIGRTYMDMLDEDGVVFIKKTEDNLQDKFVNVKITEVLNYDLVGEIIKIQE